MVTWNNWWMMSSFCKHCLASLTVIIKKHCSFAPLKVAPFFSNKGVIFLSLFLISGLVLYLGAADVGTGVYNNSGDGSSSGLPSLAGVFDLVDGGVDISPGHGYMAMAMGVLSYICIAIPLLWGCLINCSRVRGLLGFSGPESTAKRLDSASFAVLLFSVVNIPVSSAAGSVMVLGLSPIILYGSLMGLEHLFVPAAKKAQEYFYEWFYLLYEPPKEPFTFHHSWNSKDLGVRNFLGEIVKGDGTDESPSKGSRFQVSSVYDSVDDSIHSHSDNESETSVKVVAADAQGGSPCAFSNPADDSAPSKGSRFQVSSMYDSVDDSIHSHSDNESETSVKVVAADAQGGSPCAFSNPADDWAPSKESRFQVSSMYDSVDDSIHSHSDNESETSVKVVAADAQGGSPCAFSNPADDSAPSKGSRFQVSSMYDSVDDSIHSHSDNESETSVKVVAADAQGGSPCAFSNLADDSAPSDSNTSVKVVAADAQGSPCTSSNLVDLVESTYSSVFTDRLKEESYYASFEGGLIRFWMDNLKDPLWVKTICLLSESDFSWGKALFDSGCLSLEQVCMLWEWKVGIHESSFGYGEAGMEAAWRSMVEEGKDNKQVLTLLIDTRCPYDEWEVGYWYMPSDMHLPEDRARLHKVVSLLHDNSAMSPYYAGSCLTSGSEMGEFVKEVSRLEERSWGYTSAPVKVSTLAVGTGVLMFALGCALSLAEVFFR